MPRPPEPWIERILREAAEAGEFDDLEGSGKPIPDLDLPYDAVWWARRWFRRNRDLETVIDTAATVQRRLPAVMARADEAAVRAGLEELNEVLGAAQESVGDPAAIELLPVEALLAERRRRRAKRSAW
jgi:hypothetical protein